MNTKKTYSEHDDNSVPQVKRKGATEILVVSQAANDEIITQEDNLKNLLSSFAIETKTTTSVAHISKQVNPTGDTKARKGKNFSANRTRDKRNKNDFYQTPYSLTRLFLNEQPLTGSILEPCCGDGAITKILSEHNYNYEASDIENNFLEQTKKYDTIITNPPFKQANDMLLKAFELANAVHFLLPLNYLQGIERYQKIYSKGDFHLANVRVFTRYPMFEEAIRKDGLHKTGMMAYAWYSFKKGAGETKLSHLNNDDYIIRKGRRRTNDEILVKEVA